MTPERRKTDKTAKQARALAAIAVALVVITVPVSTYVSLSREGRDRDASREAAARICQRGNYTRAELHVAYAVPAAPLPDQRILDAARPQEPLLVGILENMPNTQAASLKRVQKLNPILLCSPNLEGKGAKTLTPKEQADFVRRYKDLKLNPLPNFAPPR